MVGRWADHHSLLTNTLPMTYIAVKVGKCASESCTNRASAGEMQVLIFDGVPTPSLPVVLVLCAPCAAAVQEEMAF